jgi:hypothetical protein
MLSTRTLLEVITIIENWTAAELDRFAVAFNIVIPDQVNGQNLSKAKKANIIFEKLSQNEIAGPFSPDVQLDSIQYILDKFLRVQPVNNDAVANVFGVEQEPVQTPAQQFEVNYIRLVNSLKRDGYTINNKQVVSLLPEELIDDNVENELFRLLNKFEFNTAKGHLEQAIDNHSNGNWAGANGQFRTFMESLLVSISNHLIPDRNCTGFADAIQWLANSTMLIPTLLSQDLNEVPSQNCNKPYINGLWKRLHPTGSHPGLSDEEDSTFRYHTLIVFARYLLKRIESRT